MKHQIKDKNVQLAEHNRTVKRLGEQVKTQNEQIADFSAKANVDFVHQEKMELVLELD
jgi:hypothetical protein